MPAQPIPPHDPATAHRPFDVDAYVREGVLTATRERGALNIVLAGRPGAGRSTLVDAIFGADPAAPGTGTPVSPYVTRYRRPGRPLAIYDTPGIEPGGSAAAVARDCRTVIRANAADPADRVHFAVYCVRATDGRFEDVEADLVRSLAEDVLVVLVLTRCPSPDDEDVTRFAGSLAGLGLPVLHGRPYPALAVELRVAGITLAPFGLAEIVEAVGATLDEGSRRALVSLQRVSPEMKHAEARRVIDRAVAVVSGVVLVPIPVADAVPVGALQLRMLGRIGVAMGVDADPAAVSAGILGVSGTARGVAGFFAIFPGVGAVIDVSAAVATTKALGEAYLAACTTLLRRRTAGVRQEDRAAELAREFRDGLRRRTA